MTHWGAAAPHHHHQLKGHTMTQNEIVELALLAVMFVLIPLTLFVAIASETPPRKRRKARKSRR